MCAYRECIADSNRPYGSSSSALVTTGFTVDQRYWVFQNHHGECTLKQSQVSVRKIPSRKFSALHIMIVAFVAIGMRELLIAAVADVRWDQRASSAAVLAALPRVCVLESTYQLRLVAILITVCCDSRVPASGICGLHDAGGPHAGSRGRRRLRPAPVPARPRPCAAAQRLKGSTVQLRTGGTASRVPYRFVPSCETGQLGWISI